MSFETGLNFELLLKNLAVSKRHCKKYFYLEFLAGKESMVVWSKMVGIAFFIPFANFHRQDDQLWG